MHLKKVLASFLLTVFLLSITAMTNAQISLFTEIVNKSNTPSNRSPKTDITPELLRYIPIGSPLEMAKTVLLANGFTVRISHANGKNYLTGSREINRSLLGFEEARLSMTVVNDKVATGSGSIFRQTL